MSERIAVAFFLLGITLLPVAGARAADGQESEAAIELKQFQAEEKADLELNGDARMAFSNHTGKLTVFTKDQIEASDDKTIIGTFVCGAATHLVKTVSNELFAKLEKSNGKSVTLSAKLRNNGKYIYVDNVVLGGAGYDGAPRRGGL